MATHDPHALLQRLCQEPSESAWLEFKASNFDPDMIGQRISACANAAILAEKDRAFLVFGVEDGTKKKIGAQSTLATTKKGGENLQNYLSRMISPSIMMDFVDFEEKGKRYSIITIEPTYERPVRFSGVEYIRVGENTKKLSEFPEYERALWLATSRRKFENAVARSHQKIDEVRALLSVETYYELTGSEAPAGDSELIRRFCQEGFIVDDMQGGFDITNLGAILFARDVKNFPSINGKTVRLIIYSGRDKTKSIDEMEGRFGYAVGFTKLLSHIMKTIPGEEQYIGGVRRRAPIFPEIAIREVLANALIHQDFTISGSGPVVEIYTDRIEVSNPGNSLIEVDRIIDERRSRNEKLASAMRYLGICEERGGGIDKALMQIESANLPPPDFQSSQNSMRVILYGPKPFSKLTKGEKLRACFYHCVIRWLTNDYMSNSSLRERFSLRDEDYQAVSAIISESVKLRRIAPADENQGKRNARYVPYWSR